MEEKKSSSKLTIVAFLSIVALAFLVVFTNSKFQEAVGIASDSGRVAFFIGDGSFEYDLKGIELAPGDDPYEFDFSISNFKGSQVTEVATEYTINMNDDIMGRLPLSYSIYSVDAMGDNENMLVEDFSNSPYKSDIIPPGSSLNGQTTKFYRLKIHWSGTPSSQRDIIHDNQLKVVRLTFKVEQVD